MKIDSQPKMFTFFSKVKLSLVLCLLLSGCALPQMTLVNNTPYSLAVTASNRLVATNVPSGQILTIPVLSPFQSRVGVAVAAYDTQGAYVGANDWIFYVGQEQVWRVYRVQSPQP